MLGDTFHNGVNQGGNKSFCSYRMGVGVPGYTGFVPVEENIEIPTKTGCAERAPLQRGGNASRGDGSTIMKPKSTFKADFSLTPAEFAQGTTPNPLWDIHGKRPVGDPPFIRRPSSDAARPFIGSSTFSDAYNNGFEAQNYPSDVTNTGQLRPPGTKHKEGHQPFYTTEYMQKSEEGNLHRSIKKVLPPGPEPRKRANRDISGISLRNPELSTSYRDSFGQFGERRRRHARAKPRGRRGEAGKK